MQLQNPASVQDGTCIFLDVVAWVCWIYVDATAGKRLSSVFAEESILLEYSN